MRERKLTGVTGPDAHENLANVDTGNNTVRLAEGTTHTSLESIGSGARQHLVDADDVEGVGADAKMETFLSGSLDEVPSEIFCQSLSVFARGKVRGYISRGKGGG